MVFRNQNIIKILQQEKYLSSLDLIKILQQEDWNKETQPHTSKHCVNHNKQYDNQ